MMDGEVGCDIDWLGDTGAGALWKSGKWKDSRMDDRGL